MSLSMRCPKCGGPMEAGFLRDSVQGKRVEGPGPRSFWTGAGPKGRDEHPVRSYRCGGCGFLESYARPEAPEE